MVPRYEAKSLEGFIQQLAVGYVSHGYWYYVTGWIPPTKDPRVTDEKIARQYEIGLTKSSRMRRKQAGYANVGSAPGGVGRFGQLDMAGNVWEWTLDYYAAAYPKPCMNCANFTPGMAATRTIRGGIQNPQGGDVFPTVLMNGNRGIVDPANQAFDDGVRCARK